MVVKSCRTPPPSGGALAAACARRVTFGLEGIPDRHAAHTQRRGELRPAVLREARANNLLGARIEDESGDDGGS